LSAAQIDLLPQFKHVIKEEAATQEKIKQMAGGVSKNEEEDNQCMVCMTSFDDLQSDFMICKGG